jgi:hypothetical protein
MNNSDRVRPSFSTLLIYLALAASVALSVAAAPATAPHGAMPMPEQQKRLDQLITGLTTPPPGVDPAEHPVRGKVLAPDDPKMRALEAYIIAQRKGVSLDYGKR